jgi:hypothetical protein
MNFKKVGLGGMNQVESTTDTQSLVITANVTPKTTNSNLLLPNTA